MRNPLPHVARQLDIPERSLRRAAGEGLIRGQRVSSRKFMISVGEQEYLRRYWGLLSDLRQALRTEPNVRLAVLFGSQARGTGREGSDIDLMVAVKDGTSKRIGQLADRLSKSVHREIQIVDIDSAEKSPLLMADILEEGRVLVDRESRWPRLLGSKGIWEKKASLEPDLESVAKGLSLGD